ncbi:hypothetical protein [Thalassobius sp. Cn5-15]|uniref:hypothetical protein n=1 Tax=Thalassobius sp. Cn5-15 TaxID=2917763 RepID=UPI001EF21E88|nr:hypothetical protein [Thalassobius sp. Cn5-15]MCG7495222.1 hypothetical protein [Thalassobius sp. Cn5-15]
MAAKLIGALITTAVVAVGSYHFWYELGDMVWPSRDVIVAEITLDNRCDFRDYVFVVRDLNTGKYATFHGGRAKLRTVERNRVAVEFAPKYRDVDYHSVARPVRKNMTMITNCGRPRPFSNVSWFG